jgi:ABC-type glycerol-3-phosphate transport system substrate-binding protein
MRAHAVVFAAALTLAPLGANAANLVVWWEKGYYPQENEAVGEIVAAFEQRTGNQVELVLIDEEELPDAFAAALDAGQPPDFGFGTLMAPFIAEWAFGDQLVDLSDAIGSFADTFDPDALDRTMLVNATTGHKTLYALPMGRTNNHLHVWTSLLEQAGFTLADIPKEWGAFWSFWCDEVQPAARQATGREDIWGIGLPMSVVYDTQFESAPRPSARPRDRRARTPAAQSATGRCPPEIPARCRSSDAMSPCHRRPLAAARTRAAASTHSGSGRRGPPLAGAPPRRRGCGNGRPSPAARP